MSEFKVGDRVRVYGFGDSPEQKPQKGTIETVCENGWLWVQEDQSEDELRCHSKQCRRLKKKERTRIWIPLSDVPSGPGVTVMGATIHSVDPHTNYLEFIEVKK